VAHDMLVFGELVADGALLDGDIAQGEVLHDEVI
jgi:hypothetical protein